jgi:hypothetical protein
MAGMRSHLFDCTLQEDIEQPARQRVLFTLAAMLFYPIVPAIGFMPEKTQMIRNFGQELPCAEALPFVQVHDRITGGDKSGCQQKNEVHSSP